MKVDFTVNGKAVSVDVPPDQPLLWVLRDTLHIQGPKFGCGVGQCGACTVHIAGKAAKSCQVQAQAAAGAKVVTIEGLSPTGQHPLQQAWRDLDVPDCGYCQGGQIMAAASLLATTANPTDAQIDAAMSGNLCRCGTYLRIRQAIHRAAQVNQPAAKRGGGGDGAPASDAVEARAGATPLALVEN